MKNFFKKQNGFTTADIVVAIGIIILFTGIITTISYNIYLASTAVKRNSLANSYIITVFEEVEKKQYDEVEEEALIEFFETKYSGDSSVSIDGNTPFNVTIEVKPYESVSGTNSQLDLIKEVTIKVSYRVGSKIQEIKMTRIKQREVLVVPNKPDIEGLKKIETGKKIFAVKYENEQYEICSGKDSGWYNYSIGNWALVLVTTKDFTVGEKIEETNINVEGEVYVWVPRYSYDASNNIEFLYSTTTKYIYVQDKNITGETGSKHIQNSLREIQGMSIYFGENETGKWVKESLVNKGNEYNTLNLGKYKRKNI